MGRVFGTSALLVLLATARVTAQPNRCAACHFAHLPEVPAPQLLADWSRSAHGRHDVGCDSCHGGDPTTYHSVDAHRGVVRSRDPLSHVNRAALSLTCAGCHAGVVAAFRSSAHERARDREAVPTCTACHGPMGGELPSPVRLESACRGCHQAGRSHADYGGLARERVESLVGLDQTLSRLDRSIQSIGDGRQRNRLSAELLLARASVRAAFDSVHTCDFRVMDEQRAVAERRTSALVSALLGTD